VRFDGVKTRELMRISGLVMCRCARRRDGQIATG
jgi:hypothetical protein